MNPEPILKLGQVHERFGQTRTTVSICATQGLLPQLHQILNLREDTSTSMGRIVSRSSRFFEMSLLFLQSKKLLSSIAMEIGTIISKRKTATPHDLRRPTYLNIHLVNTCHLRRLVRPMCAIYSLSRSPCVDKLETARQTN